MQYTPNPMLTLPNITDEMVKFRQLLATNSNIDLDLSLITHIDTAGIAILLEFKQLAKQYNCQVRVTNITPAITRLAGLYKITI